MKEKEVNTETERQKLLQISEISLMLDTYDDIFSDFDPRPYSERSLSIDLLEEAERASKDKRGMHLELNFLIPLNIRNKSLEEIIKRRLKEHFRKHFNRLEKEKKDIIKKGLLFTFIGISVMFIATLMLHKNQGKTLLINFLIILFEPAGWFLFWEGLDQAIFESKKINPRLKFYEKMHKCHINFFSY